MKIPQSVRELLSKAYADPRTEVHQCSESFFGCRQFSKC